MVVGSASVSHGLMGYQSCLHCFPFSPSLPLSLAAPPEECPALLSSATGAAHPPAAAAEASDTMPGAACTEDGPERGTEDGPEPAAEESCVLPAATERDEGEYIEQSLPAHALWWK